MQSVCDRHQTHVVGFENQWQFFSTMLLDKCFQIFSAMLKIFFYKRKIVIFPSYYNYVHFQKCYFFYFYLGVVLLFIFMAEKFESYCSVISEPKSISLSF